MTQLPVTASLSLFLPPEDLVPLPEVPAAIAADRGRFGPYSEQSGVLTIRHGEDEARLADVVMWMVPGVCLEVVGAVMSDGQGEKEMWESDATIALQRDGDEIALTGEYLAPMRLPAEPLLRALLDVYMEFMAVAETLWSDDLEAEDVAASKARAAELLAALGTG